ncbi:Ubiquitin domain-containing protein DSK2a [Carex littledalei]|uniref:Ubiquitin domain-containing protein DSK2a n=1 Tax=Carex littledalei TaxID=544730 RepID=A0A833QVE6_9POAL|nr:Ubiquitin domain-containing protein DSK2a [Carex littledalei]
MSCYVSSDPILCLPTDIAAILYVAAEIDMELGEYIRPILEKLYPIPYIVDYVWGASNDGGTGVTRNVAVPEELFASQLADMEHTGFMDRRENIIALLSSWGDVEKAVKRLNFRKNKSEEAGEDNRDENAS